MQRFKALRTILRLGSFTKAAHALGYTQSSISQMMASLEEELSFKLLIRSRNGITLTQEGQQLYPFLEQVLHSYEAMEEKAREIRGLDSCRDHLKYHLPLDAASHQRIQSPLPQCEVYLSARRLQAHSRMDRVGHHRLWLCLP